MFKLTATLETATETYEQEYTFKTGDEVQQMKRELRATQPKGSSVTYSVTGWEE